MFSINDIRQFKINITLLQCIPSGNAPADEYFSNSVVWAWAGKVTKPASIESNTSQSVLGHFKILFL